MTKDEAIQAMNEGKTVRHRYFSDDEWMKKNSNNSYIFEDGVICPVNMFWSDRYQPDWEFDWEIVENK
jgi:hypothetical protein